jgi:hypothetical protein
VRDLLPSRTLLRGRRTAAGDLTNTPGGAAVRMTSCGRIARVVVGNKTPLENNTEAVQPVDDAFRLARHERLDDRRNKRFGLGDNILNPTRYIDTLSHNGNPLWRCLTFILKGMRNHCSMFSSKLSFS